MKMYRQGDVLIMEVSSISEKTSPDVEKSLGKGKSIRLAEGEMTGHHHTLHGAIAAAVLMKTGDIMFQLKNEGRLQHQEHDEIILPPGEYISRRQVVYTPEKIQRVAD